MDLFIPLYAQLHFTTRDIFLIKEIVPHYVIFGNPKGGKVKK